MSIPRAEIVTLDITENNWLEVVRDYVSSLRFGTVEVLVRDKQVVEIEKTERVRLAKNGDVEVPAAITPVKTTLATNRYGQQR